MLKSLRQSLPRKMIDLLKEKVNSMSITRYTKELLDTIVLRDSVILIGEYPKLSAYISINFKCKCGEEHKKYFRYIIENGGMFCRKCTLKQSRTKMEESTLKKFGVRYATQAQSIKDKIVKTNIERRGVAYILQDPKIRAQAKATMLATLGVENPSQSNIIKEKKKVTLMEHYGVDHNFKSPEIIEQRKNTYIMNYGVENPFANKDIQEKIKNTHMTNRGVDNPMKDSKTMDKAKATNLVVRGVEYSLQDPSVRDKGKTTNMEKYGVEYASQDPNVKEKTKATNIILYGTESPMQNHDIQAKAQKGAYKLKLYTLPSGNQIKLQGYEPWALDELLKTYKEDQIITDRAKVPRIEYIYNEKQHYYFPDIYIPHTNSIIEVKSTWTYKCKQDITNVKAEATKAKGYIFDIWLFDAKGHRIPA